MKSPNNVQGPKSFHLALQFYTKAQTDFERTFQRFHSSADLRPPSWPQMKDQKACDVPAFRLSTQGKHHYAKKNDVKILKLKIGARSPLPTHSHRGSGFRGLGLCQPPFAEVTCGQGCPRASGNSSLRCLKEEAALEPKVLQSLSQGQRILPFVEGKMLNES